jgi:PPK2 family polyphosphate:nucleotide phosphotransferase
MDIDRFRVRPDDRRAIKRHAPDFTGPFKNKDEALGHRQKGLERLEDLQGRLYAHDRYALLLIFQGMDAAGKDHVIKHVMSGVDPQGTQVHSFKRPSDEELDHDFLWRTTKALPERGRIGIFNRSHYEEVLVVRVHKELLHAQKLPDKCITKDIWDERFEDIRAYERHLWRNGTIIRKFFLNVSKAEQRRRFLERIDDPAKNWKFSSGDLVERDHWKAYQSAYADALAATSRHHAPWYVIPADNKWFAQALVSDIVIDALEHLELRTPKLDADKRRDLAKARRLLSRT